VTQGDEFFRVGDRVLLISTDGSPFDFAGAGLVAMRSLGDVIQLPDHDGVRGSVVVQFDGIGGGIAVLVERLQLVNPVERLARES
jgi:hypothetical protein